MEWKTSNLSTSFRSKYSHYSRENKYFIYEFINTAKKKTQKYKENQLKVAAELNDARKH